MLLWNTVKDVLVEGNAMIDSDEGLHVIGNLTERLFLRNNVGL
jgi:hypothetical protein